MDGEMCCFPDKALAAVVSAVGTAGMGRLDQAIPAVLRLSPMRNLSAGSAEPPLGLQCLDVLLVYPFHKHAL